MAVSYNEIPSDLRIPFMHIELDATPTASATDVTGPSLLIGQRLSTGTVAEGVPTLITSASQAAEAFGPGSQLAFMCAAYLRNDPTGELWAIALDDKSGGTAATKTITVTGPATADGTIYLYIAGRLVEVAVSDEDTASDIATAIAAAVTAAGTKLPVTASSSDAVVTLTCRHKGTLGDQIDVRVNYRGAAAGEGDVPGVTLTIAAGAAGATDPDYADAVDAMGDELYDYIALGLSTTAALDAISAELSSRYTYSRGLYGVLFAVRQDTVGNLQTAGALRNAIFEVTPGITSSPTPPWELAAMFTAQAARSSNIMPSRPWHTLPLVGAVPPARADRHTLTEQQTLTGVGISTFSVVGRGASGGTLTISREVTTYQADQFGTEDDTYQDPQRVITAFRSVRRLKSRLQRKFNRMNIVDDGTPVRPGLPVTTPSAIRAEIVAEYAAQVADGWMERLEDFQESLIVERDPDNSRRVNVYLKPTTASPFRILAARMQPAS